MKKLMFVLLLGAIGWMAYRAFVAPPDYIKMEPVAQEIKMVGLSTPDMAPVFNVLLTEEEAPPAAPLWQTILNVVLGGLTVLAGRFWQISKGKLGKAIGLLKSLLDGLEDNQLTPGEIDDIKAKFKEFIE